LKKAITKNINKTGIAKTTQAAVLPDLDTPLNVTSAIPTHKATNKS